MPFATRKPDASINLTNAEYPPFVLECGFTETYPAILSDARSWLENTSGAVCAVLLIKLTETTTPLIPPPLSIDVLAEDDNSPAELNADDPAYEHLRESTKSEDWVGPLTAFAELWRLDPGAGRAKRDGERVTILPRPEGGVEKVRITRADLKGRSATAADRSATWDLDLEMYLKMLLDSVERMAFQRRVRYIKAMEAQKVDSGEAPAV